MKKGLLFISMLIFLAVIAMGQHDKNVMVYSVTSTDCGPCSCNDSIYKHSVLPAYPNTIVTAYHGIGSYFGVYQGNDVVNEFRPDYEPSGFPDGLGYDVYYLDITDTIGAIYDREPKTPVGINITTKIYDFESRNVELIVSMSNDGPELDGAYWYNIIVTEDNIKHTHRTMDSCSTPDVQGLPFRNNYFNNWVTRSMIYMSNGDSLVGPSWGADQSITRSCSFEIDTAWVAENCHVTVNVYKKADSIYQARVMQVIRETIIESSAISDNLREKDAFLRVYPNPASGYTHVHIELGSPSYCELQLMDMNGKSIRNILNGVVEKGKYNIEVSTLGIPAGTYLLLLETGKTKSVRKLIIN